MYTYIGVYRAPVSVHSLQGTPAQPELNHCSFKRLMLLLLLLFCLPAHGWVATAGPQLSSSPATAFIDSHSAVLSGHCRPGLVFATRVGKRNVWRKCGVLFPAEVFLSRVLMLGTRGAMSRTVVSFLELRE